MRANKPPTIRDVARVAGVSVTTVSFVLSGGPRPVSVTAREKILAAIRELGFRPNAMARNLASRQANQIGVVFSNFGHRLVANPYAGGLLDGILDAGYDLGLGILIIRGFGDWERDLTPFVGNGRTDGTILIAPLANDPTSALFEQLPGERYVEIAPFLDGRDLQCPTIDVDNAGTIRVGVQHLVELGHRRIAHITGEASQQASIDRRAAFLAAVEEFGLEVPPNFVREGSFSSATAGHQTLLESARDLLTMPGRPTAVLCANDHIAGELLKLAIHLGVQVPAEMSVVGFDDHPGASLTNPPLTSLGQPLNEMGRLSLRRLVSLINDQPVEPLHLKVPGTLVIRNSTGPPPAA